MTDQIKALGLITVKSKLLESELREAGAQGAGLKELSQSVSHLFDEAGVIRMRRVYELRNKAMHEHVFQIDQRALDSYISNVDSIIEMLSRRKDTASGHLKWMAATGYVYQASSAPLVSGGEQCKAAPPLHVPEALAKVDEHKDDSLVDSVVKEAKPNTSRVKLLSAEQREGLAFDKSQSKPYAKVTKPLVSPAMKKTAQKLAINIATRAVLSVLRKII